MSTAYVGELSIEACLPLPVGLLLTAMADLQAKLTAMLAFSVKLGLPALSISAQLELAAQITASLNAALQIGLTPPSISAQLDIVLAVIVQLQVELDLYLNIFSLLANAGVFVYAIDAATNAVGGELSTALASGFPGHAAGDHANVLVLGTVSGATWAAMSQIFKVTP